MNLLLPEPQKIMLSKLPYAFRRRLITLAPPKIVNELSKLCPDVKKIRRICPEAYGHIFITDSNKVFRWASEDTFFYRVFKFLHQITILRYFLDGIGYTNPMWETVVRVKDIRRKEQHIYVEETLVLYCKSISSYDSVIPNICGSYTRLILHGNIRSDQVLRLIHPGVKRVRINARIHMLPQYYDYFADFTARQFHGFNSCFVLCITPTVTPQLRAKLREASLRHDREYEEIEGSIGRIFIQNSYNVHFYSVTLFLLACSCAVVFSKITDLLVVATYGESFFIIIYVVLCLAFGVSSFVLIIYLFNSPPGTDGIQMSNL